MIEPVIFFLLFHPSLHLRLYIPNYKLLPLLPFGYWKLPEGGCGWGNDCERGVTHVLFPERVCKNARHSSPGAYWFIDVRHLIFHALCIIESFPRCVCDIENYMSLSLSLTMWPFIWRCPPRDHYAVCVSMRQMIIPIIRKPLNRLFTYVPPFFWQYYPLAKIIVKQNEYFFQFYFQRTKILHCIKSHCISSDWLELKSRGT